MEKRWRGRLEKAYDLIEEAKGIIQRCHGVEVTPTGTTEPSTELEQQNMQRACQGLGAALDAVSYLYSKAGGGVWTPEQTKKAQDLQQQMQKIYRKYNTACAGTLAYGEPRPEKQRGIDEDFIEKIREALQASWHFI